MGSAGNLYGTTGSFGSAGVGVVFNLAPNRSGGYTESVLHTFTGNPHSPDLSGDGANPNALIRDSMGDLYGTTAYGGTDNAGIAFELTPNGSGGYTESVLYTFSGGPYYSAGSDGGAPWDLIMDSSGNLYGVANGSNQYGIVWEIPLH